MPPYKSVSLAVVSEIHPVYAVAKLAVASCPNLSYEIGE